MSGLTAFVTGGTGFIGRLVVEELRQRAYHVRVLARDSLKFDKLFGGLEDVEAVPGDALDRRALLRGLRGVSLVFHLAGVTKAVRSADFQAGNQEACRVLRETIQLNELRVDRVLHVSSLAAMGPSPTAEPPEDFDPPAPLSRYGCSKLAGELEMQILRDSVPVTVVRPPVVFGPADTDVFLFMRTVWRSFIPILGHDEKRVSFVFAPDLARGMIDAALCPAAAGKAYYLCYPEPLRWSEFGAWVADALGVTRRNRRIPHAALAVAAIFAELWARLARRPTILNLDKYREGVRPYWVCSPRAAQADFGFQPACSPAEAVRRTVAWYREHGWLPPAPGQADPNH